MAQVMPLRPHTFRVDNLIIDAYAAEIGALGVAIYAVLQRYADRTTGQCWPSVATIARLLRLSRNCVKKYLHLLARRGLITIAPRTTAEGDPTSNLYTVHDPTQRDAVQRRQQTQGRVSPAGGGPPDALPPQPTAHLLPQGGASGGLDQDPSQQRLTSAVPPASLTLPDTQTQTQPPLTVPCTQPGHRHWSPEPDLWICHECYCCWVPTSEASLPTAVPTAEPAPPLPATSGEPAPGPHVARDLYRRAVEPPLARRA